MSATAKQEVQIVLSDFNETLGVDEISTIMGSIRNSEITQFVFKMELDGIVNSAWECDIAFTWMELLVFMEGIYPFCDSCDYEIEGSSIPVATILAVPKDHEGIACFIENVMFACWQVQEMDSGEYWGQVWEIHDKIVKGKPLSFPKLGDDYMANLINDSSGNYESDEDLPSWKLGFWRSNIAAREGLVGYASSECIIVFNGADAHASSLAKLLRSLGHSHSLQIRSGVGLVLADRSHPLLLTGEWGYRVSREVLCRAQEAIRAILRENGKDESALSLHEVDTSVCQASEMASIKWRGVEICIPCSRLRPNELDHVMSKLLPPAPDVNWSVLDEDIFEELGYDILIDRGYERVERMGTVYTPDGGRDLVAYRRGAAQSLYLTELALGQSKKWIFQCKYSTRDQLRLSDLGSFVDVVAHYNASGYGIITNAAIAPQIYDRLLALKANPGMPFFSDYDVFSGSEISRIICSRPVLFRKYFRRD
jgi:hypothetical protein